MKTCFGFIVIAFLSLVIFSRFETEITTFLKTTPHGTLLIIGLVGALIMAEATKKPAKKKD